jgi:hypothetical protein
MSQLTTGGNATREADQQQHAVGAVQAPSPLPTTKTASTAASMSDSDDGDSDATWTYEQVENEDRPTTPETPTTPEPPDLSAEEILLQEKEARELALSDPRPRLPTYIQRRNAKRTHRMRHMRQEWVEYQDDMNMLANCAQFTKTHRTRCRECLYSPVSREAKQSILDLADETKKYKQALFEIKEERDMEAVQLKLELKSARNDLEVASRTHSLEMDRLQSQLAASERRGSLRR